MTRDEILAMQPSRELDVEVGKLLGCQVIKEQTSACHFRYTLVVPGGINSIDWSTESGAWSAIPRLSSTWKGMQFLIEAMAKRGWVWEISGGPIGASGCTFTKDDDSVSKYAEASTAPHAVAIAALLALEGKHA